MTRIRNALFACVIGWLVAGCASPTIVIQPALPKLAAHGSSGELNTVRLVMDGMETPQLSQYEEKGEKTQIGDSESLGVHMSDFWLEEQPAAFVRRVLEANLKAWGHQVVTDQGQIELRGHVNKFSLQSRAINAFQFQANGMIDVDLKVNKAGGASSFAGNYVGKCTFTTATEIPNNENMNRLFSQCVEELQKQVESDSRLRAALLAN